MNTTTEEIKELNKEIEKIKALVERTNYSIQDVEKFISENFQGTKEMLAKDSLVSLGVAMHYPPNPK
jgi:predicted DNA binding CopG/RHH family protein